MSRERWAVEPRVTRSPADRDKELPQVIAEGCARWVWGCFDGEQFRVWCGARHESEALAKDHAGLLNAGIRGART